MSDDEYFLTNCVSPLKDVLSVLERVTLPAPPSLIAILLPSTQLFELANPRVFHDELQYFHPESPKRTSHGLTFVCRSA